MPAYEVEGPDGTIYEVTAGNDAEARSKVRAHLSSGQARPQRPNNWMNEIEGAMSSFNRGIPFSSEITSAAAAIGAGLQGQDPREAFRNQTQRTQEASADFRARRPNSAALAEGTGMAAPILMTGGAAAPELAGARVGGMLTQIPRAATIGGAYGYAYGAGGQDQAGAPLQERVDAGNQGAAFGAALGAATPPAVSLTRSLVAPAYSLARNATRRIPTPAPNTLGANGGNLRAVPPSPPPRGGLAPVVGRAVDRLAERSGQSAQQVEQRLQGYRINPQGQVLADAFDTPGVQQVRSMTQFPGQTAQRAAERAHQRATSQPERILTDLNRRLRVTDTPQQALAALERQYAQASNTMYRPIFQRRLNDVQRAGLQHDTGPLLEAPIMRSAAQRARALFENQRQLGMVTGTIDDNFPRWLHFVKMGLDDTIAAGRREGSMGANELRVAMEAKNQLLRTMDTNIPGYRNARRYWGGIAEAEEALDTGAQMFNMPHADIAAGMERLTPFAQYHARVGFANEVANRIGLRGRVNGNVNVAEVLGSPEMQARVRAMFSSPEEAAAFLDTLNQQNQLMRNASQWGGGSPTAANLAFQEDNLANALLDAGGHAARGNAAQAVAGLWGQARNAATLGLQERANNQVGEALLRRVDAGDDSAAFVRQVIEELQRREAARFRAAQLSRVGSAAAGAQQGRRRQ